MKVPFHKPLPASISSKISREIEGVYATGQESVGPIVWSFERELRERQRSGTHVVATASCTDAMTMALIACRARRVVIPDLSWNATFNAVINAGATPILCDVTTSGVMRDPVALVVNSNADTVLTVDLYGNHSTERQPWPMQLKQMGINVIVDAAQGFENRYNHNVEDARCLSFHAMKSLRIGTGGAVVTRHNWLADDVSSMRYQGVSAKPGTFREQVLVPGFKSVLPPVAAAAGVVLLRHVGEFYVNRKATINSYRSAFDANILSLPRCAPEDDAMHAFVVVPDDPEQLVQHLERNSIGYARYYKPFSMQPALKPFYQQFDVMKTSTMLSRGVALPLDSTMTAGEALRVVSVMNEYEGSWQPMTLRKLP